MFQFSWGLGVKFYVARTTGFREYAILLPPQRPPFMTHYPLQRVVSSIAQIAVVGDGYAVFAARSGECITLLGQKVFLSESEMLSSFSF